MLNFVRFWILLSALLVSAGWILSALHQLNRIGYGIVFALAGIAFFLWQSKTGWRPKKTPAQLLQKFRRRCRRPAPLIFFILASLALLSGILYPPLNGDAEAYRLPRVLHWLWAGQWHWIHAFDARLNVAACGFEWLSAPLFLFTRTDRFLFLINWVSFLLLPGLIFSVLTRLQVRPRVAWWWMWLLASGWCFVLQAGSIANDSFAAIYILAAVNLALRAREKKSVADLWLSLLAAALVTGVKQTNLPLALLWLIAAWPGVRLFWTRPMGSFIIAAFALLISIVPTSILNYEHYGTWLPLEVAGFHSARLILDPFWGVIGNAFCIPLQNLLPPFFPWLGAWSAAMRHFLQTPFGAHFATFEDFGALRAGVGEVNAGLGLGIFFLTAISFLAARRIKNNSPHSNDATVRWLRVMPWLLLLVFMAKDGAFQNARQLAPYYVFFFPVILARPGQIDLVRRRWWRSLGLLTLALAVGLLIIDSYRPLFPAQNIFARLQADHPGSKSLLLLAKAYGFEPALENQKRRVAAALPPDEVIGYASSYDRFEPCLWLPLGQRRVERVLPDDPPAELRRKKIRHVVFEELPGQPLDQWLKKFDGEIEKIIVPEKNFTDQIATLYLVRLRDDPAPEPAR
jgi:hypothetical protein